MSDTTLIVVKILIILIGLLGVLGHWATRWYGNRTTSTFYEYLFSFKGRTFASLSANFATSITTCAIITPNLNFEQILTFIGMSYMAGYTWDSKLNKDLVQIPQEIGEISDEKLNDMLADRNK